MRGAREGEGDEEWEGGQHHKESHRTQGGAQSGVKEEEEAQKQTLMERYRKHETETGQRA